MMFEDIEKLVNFSEVKMQSVCFTAAEFFAKKNSSF